jgi:hypothetical protein
MVLTANSRMVYKKLMNQKIFTRDGLTLLLLQGLRMRYKRSKIWMVLSPLLSPAAPLRH